MLGRIKVKLSNQKFVRNGDGTLASYNIASLPESVISECMIFLLGKLTQPLISTASANSLSPLTLN